MTGEGLDELRERIAERFADRFEDVRLLLPYEDGAKLAELYALGAPIDERETEETACYVRARLPQREVRAGSRRYLIAEHAMAPRAEAGDRAPGRAPARRRDPSFAGVRRRRRPRPAPRASASSSARASAAIVGTGLAVAIPEGYAGFVLPRSGLAARHGITMVNAPGLIDSGYRGEMKVILLNTDRSEPFVVEPGMRIAQLVVLEVAERATWSRSRSFPRASAAPAAGLGLVAAD